MLKRIRTLIVTLWLGLLLSLAFLVAPTAFAQLERGTAGALAGALFRAEAYMALALAMLLFMMERRLAAQSAEAGQGAGLSLNLLLVLGALFCTVLGYFALQPMMAAARLGQGPYSFGLLHGISSGLFALKAVLLALLAWRSTRP